MYCRIIPTGSTVRVYNNIIRPPGCLRDVHGSQLIPPPLLDTVFPNATITAATARLPVPSKQTIDPIDFHNKLYTPPSISSVVREIRWLISPYILYNMLIIINFRIMNW